MKKLTLASILVIAAISGPALADDFLVACKANPVEGAPQAGVDAFCTCADKETTGNTTLRAEFMQGLKEKTVEKRMAMASAAAIPVVQKCTPKQ